MLLEAGDDLAAAGLDAGAEPLDVGLAIGKARSACGHRRTEQRESGERGQDARWIF